VAAPVKGEPEGGRKTGVRWSCAERGFGERKSMDRAAYGRERERTEKNNLARREKGKILNTP